MKKILLGTSTLVGVVALAAAAQADAPKITVGGFTDFQAGILSDDLDDAQRNHAFRNDTEISFKVDGKSDAGLGYGAEVWLEADVDSDALASDQDNQGVNASKTFVYLDGMWGRLEGGSNLGPNATMKVDASSIARATGGIDGDFTYFSNAATIFLATPDLPMNYGLSGRFHRGGALSFLGDESQENLTKLTYYTPRWSGFQLGVSYAPSDQERGQRTSAGTRADSTAAFLVGAGADTTTVSEAESIWQAGVSWEGKFDQIGIALAATGEAGSAEASTHEDLRAWNLGAKLTFMGFSLAGSWADWNDSLRSSTASVDDNGYWTLGAAYEFGPFGVSATWLDSEFDLGAGTNDFENISVGADYKLAPGLTPYAEVSFFEQDAVTAANDNDGTVIIVGTQLNF